MTQQTPQYASGESHDPDALGIMHHTELPATRLSGALDGIVRRIGEAVSWLWLAVIVTILVNVTLRYVFAEGSVALEELQWHITGFVWLLGIAYAVVSDHHVRVDVLHERLSLKTQTWIELLGLVLLLLPFLAVVIYYAVPYAYNAWVLGETSQAPSGLPYRWLLKFMIPIALSLVTVSALARLTRCTALLFGIPRSRRAPKP